MKNHMLLGIFAVGIAMLFVADPTPIQGGDTHHKFERNINIDSSCNVNVEYFKIQNGEITLKNLEGEKLLFKNGDLYHDGRAVYLDSHQRQLVDAYVDGIDLLIDDVVTIARDGVEIGTDVALHAAEMMLGHGDSDLAEVREMVQMVSERVNAKLAERNFDSEESVDEFEREIETEVKRVVQKVMPRIAAKMTTLALSGDEQAIREMEMKAEMIEKHVETMLEPRIKQIEAKAEGLCGQIKKLDELEVRMAHDGLDMVDVIRAD